MTIDEIVEMLLAARKEIRKMRPHADDVIDTTLYAAQLEILDSVDFLRRAQRPLAPDAQDYDTEDAYQEANSAYLADLLPR